jgi:hypothetical protein
MFKVACKTREFWHTETAKTRFQQAIKNAEMLKPPKLLKLF